MSQDHSRTFQTPRWGHQGPISRPKRDLAAPIPSSLRLNAHDLPEQHRGIHPMTCVHTDRDAVERLSGGLKTRPRPPERPSEDGGKPQIKRRSESGQNTKNINFTDSFCTCWQRGRQHRRPDRGRITPRRPPKALRKPSWKDTTTSICSPPPPSRQKGSKYNHKVT